MVIFESAIFWIIVAAASEIIALTPLKSNSVIQLVLNALNTIKPGKKELNNIPADGKWIYQFNTRSPYEKLQRLIRAKKFYATLPHKLDAAEAQWHAAQPKSKDFQFTEELEGETPLGGEMRVKLKSVTNLNNNDRND